MYKTKRLGLVLTPAEKTAVVQTAEAEGGLSQSALCERSFAMPPTSGEWVTERVPAELSAWHRKSGAFCPYCDCRPARSGMRDQARKDTSLRFPMLP